MSKEYGALRSRKREVGLPRASCRNAAYVALEGPRVILGTRFVTFITEASGN